MAGIRLNAPARTPAEKEAKVRKALRLRADGYSDAVAQRRCGNTRMAQMKAWAAELGIEWPRKGGRA